MAFCATSRLEYGIADAWRFDMKYTSLRARLIARLIAKIHQHVGEILRTEQREANAFGCSRGQHLGAVIPHGIDQRNGIGEPLPLAHGQVVATGTTVALEDSLTAPGIAWFFKEPGGV